MGQAVSFINSVIGLGKDIVQADDHKKNRKLSKEFEQLKNPISPPEYWITLKSREKNVKSGPYSVEGIRESLDNMILPAGYSTEQLNMIGFAHEVQEYEKRLDMDRKDRYNHKVKRREYHPLFLVNFVFPGPNP